MTGLVDLLAARTARERVLLSVLVLIALPLLAYFLVLAPVQTARDTALQARDDALALNAWVAARVADMPAISAPQTKPTEPIGATGIEQTLISAQLRPSVTQLVEQDNGTVELRFDAVTFVQIASWVSAQSRDGGYELDRFDMRALETTGKVSA